MNMEYDSVENISDILDNILERQPELVERFKVNGIEFGWMPDLDKMSYGELLDLNGNISDWSAMHIAMGVLYRPIKNESNGLYNIEKYEGDKYHQYIRKMPLSAVIGAMVFFWNLGLDCVKYIINSSEMDSEFQSHPNLNQTGIGIQQSMNWLVETLPSMKLLNN